MIFLRYKSNLPIEFILLLVLLRIVLVFNVPPSDEVGHWALLADQDTLLVLERHILFDFVVL